MVSKCEIKKNIGLGDEEHCVGRSKIVKKDGTPFIDVPYLQFGKYSMY